MVAAQVRGSRQRADKHGQMPRELADLALARDSIFTLHIISHSLSLLIQARQVPLVTAGRPRPFWGHRGGLYRRFAPTTRVAAVLAFSPIICIQRPGGREAPQTAVDTVAAYNSAAWQGTGQSGADVSFLLISGRVPDKPKGEQMV